jgi:four helix bundle protein
MVKVEVRRMKVEGLKTDVIRTFHPTVLFYAHCWMTDLVRRTRAVALRCLKVADKLPRQPGARAIAAQLARSGTSTAANYRAAQRARSKAEFRAKLQIALEEVDESHFWLGMIAEAGYLSIASLEELNREADELTAILVSCLKSSRRDI